MANWKEKISVYREVVADKSEMWRGKLMKFYYKFNDRLHGVPGIIRHTITNLGRARVPEASAALAYYGLFSIFPALIAIVTIGSLFVDAELARTTLFEAASGIFPVPETIAFVDAQLKAVLRVRGALTIIAGISLIWSASNVIDKVVLNVNRAFPNSSPSGFFRNRGLALIVILIVMIFFLASVALAPLIKVLPAFKFMVNDVPFTETRLWNWVSLVVPLLFKYGMFYITYTWLPNSHSISRKARAWGALVAALLWEAVNKALTWAIAKGFTNYELVYGSLASIMVLLFWIYWVGYILFFGAHLTNAINYHYKNNMARKKFDAVMEDPVP